MAYTGHPSKVRPLLRGHINRHLMSSETYQGTFLRSKSIGKLTLVEHEFAPYAKVVEHHHEHAYVSFLLQGSYNEEHDRGNSNYSSGAVIFHPGKNMRIVSRATEEDC